MSSGESSRLMDQEAAKARFNGIVHGWRLAPRDALEAEGIARRNLSLDCESRPAGAETPTQLDFKVTYFPAGTTIENSSGPSKWVCGARGLSVVENYNLDTRYGVGGLRIERFVVGRRALSMYAANDRVQASVIDGKPTILIRPIDEESGLGESMIIVIEDDVAPEFVILRVIADEVPFSEVMKVVAGVR
jgi:hypothetical protein